MEFLDLRNDKGQQQMLPDNRKRRIQEQARIDSLAPTVLEAGFKVQVVLAPLGQGFAYQIILPDGRLYRHPKATYPDYDPYSVVVSNGMKDTEKTGWEYLSEYLDEIREKRNELLAADPKKDPESVSDYELLTNKGEGGLGWSIELSGSAERWSYKLRDPSRQEIVNPLSSDPIYPTSFGTFKTAKEAEEAGVRHGLGLAKERGANIEETRKQMLQHRKKVLESLRKVGVKI